MQKVPSQQPVAHYASNGQHLRACGCAQGEARLLRDEVHRLTLELRERQLALEKLRAKYETLAAKSRAPDGKLPAPECPLEASGPCQQALGLGLGRACKAFLASGC